ncbi:MAG: TetR/AcrR family transcriptional regulator [Bacteroidales bacterium]
MEIKERIVAFANDMFFQQGIRAVTMDDIASGLGVSKRTIYEHFSDKALLIKDCLLYRRDCKRSSIETFANMNLIDALDFFLEHAGKNTLNHEREYRFISEIRKYYPVVFKSFNKEHLRDNTEVLKLIITKACKDGYFLPIINPKEIANLMIDLFDGMMQLDRGDSATVQVNTRRIIIIFFRGLATAEGITELDKVLENYKGLN